MKPLLHKRSQRKCNPIKMNACSYYVNGLYGKVCLHIFVDFIFNILLLISVLQECRGMMVR